MDKSDFDHRGIPPQSQMYKCKRGTEKLRNYFFNPSGKRKSPMKANKTKKIFVSILISSRLCFTYFCILCVQEGTPLGKYNKQFLEAAAGKTFTRQEIKQ